MGIRLKRGVKKEVISRKTLLVDGNALLKASYHGAKDVYNGNGIHIGGIYQFLMTLRKMLNENIYQNVYVFWDGKYSGRLRYEIYKQYKFARGKDFINGSVDVDQDILNQKVRIQDYLNELCIKQIPDDDIVEGDDYIAYYCINKAPDEAITILTRDRDLCQLIEPTVNVYLSDLKDYITVKNYSKYFDHHLDNGVLVKVICGDTSDSIKGVKGLGETTLLKEFPIVKERMVSVSELKVLAEEKQSNRKKPLKVLSNLIEGVTVNIETKEVITMGDKLFDRNMQLVNLKSPILNPQAVDKFNEMLKSEVEDNSNFKGVIDMMSRDGMREQIRENHTEFLLPFKKFVNRTK